MAHEQRERRGASLDTPIRQLVRRQKVHTTQKAASPKDACRLAGCGRPVRRMGLCNAHYERQKKDPGNWSGPVREYSVNVYVGDFTAPREHAEAVVAEAKLRGVSRSFVLREVLALWVESQKAPAKLPRYAREGGGADELGPEEPTFGMTPAQADARKDAIILREYQDGVSLAALAERFGDRVYAVTRDVRQPQTGADRLPFGAPAP
ncbi:hypothetical protein D7X74_30475 [Corallococcus sp. CA047B]|uniref:hypothetical protein n=1 Tax=Corallococcus sp. CA047B TaxID=2316729 RepID=UPI000EA37621|nr:hypothetical protein [Corallococcus sp. CA047B]RKH09010.1 hypothetical protein D7X74_30475 [Corallococcus sp. CA047B]